MTKEYEIEVKIEGNVLLNVLAEDDEQARKSAINLVLDMELENIQEEVNLTPVIKKAIQR